MKFLKFIFSSSWCVETLYCLWRLNILRAYDLWKVTSFVSELLFCFAYVVFENRNNHVNNRTWITVYFWARISHVFLSFHWAFYYVEVIIYMSFSSIVTSSKCISLPIFPIITCVNIWEIFFFFFLAEQWSKNIWFLEGHSCWYTTQL